MELHAILGRLDHAVERFHRRVRQMREQELGLDCGVRAGDRFAGCREIAAFAGLVGGFAAQQLLMISNQIRRRPVLGLREIPLRFHRIAGLDRGPGVPGIDRDTCASRQGFCIDKAGNVCSGGGIERGQRAAKTRAVQDHRSHHPRNAHVHGEGGRTLGLATRILTGQAVQADQAEVLWRLHDGCLGRRDARRPAGHLTEMG